MELAVCSQAEAGCSLHLLCRAAVGNAFPILVGNKANIVIMGAQALSPTPGFTGSDQSEPTMWSALYWAHCDPSAKPITLVMRSQGTIVRPSCVDIYLVIKEERVPWRASQHNEVIGSLSPPCLWILFLG